MVYTKNVTAWECFMKMIVRSDRWPKIRKKNEQGWKIENREGMNETIEVGSYNEKTASEILLPQEPTEGSNTVWKGPGNEREG